ncbi:hypothetical protein M153_222000171 [Pseudoloma neurophilia]|uniref:Uncharacterized protein n=1 Tax=Pseudoloma neurophilia TaxID=146866 RepID=A0A0R0LYZ5_9MICR|nr:hypothetical protein M153_222000171 [Pseudoloma neurophilia]
MFITHNIQNTLNFKNHFQVYKFEIKFIDFVLRLRNNEWPAAGKSNGRQVVL